MWKFWFYNRERLLICQCFPMIPHLTVAWKGPSHVGKNHTAISVNSSAHIQLLDFLKCVILEKSIVLPVSNKMRSSRPSCKFAEKNLSTLLSTFPSKKFTFPLFPIFWKEKTISSSALPSSKCFLICRLLAPLNSLFFFIPFSCIFQNVAQTFFVIFLHVWSMLFLFLYLIQNSYPLCYNLLLFSFRFK